MIHRRFWLLLVHFPTWKPQQRDQNGISYEDANCHNDKEYEFQQNNQKNFGLYYFKCRAFQRNIKV